MKFTVTRDDITRGVRKSACLCPVAECANRTLYAAGELITVIVTPASMGIYRGETNIVTMRLPANVRDTIVHYDNTGKMSPFEFDLPVEEFLK